MSFSSLSCRIKPAVSSIFPHPLRKAFGTQLPKSSVISRGLISLLSRLLFVLQATSKRYDTGHPDAQVLPFPVEEPKEIFPPRCSSPELFWNRDYSRDTCPEVQWTMVAWIVQIFHGLSPSLANDRMNTCTWTAGDHISIPATCPNEKVYLASQTQTSTKGWRVQPRGIFLKYVLRPKWDFCLFLCFDWMISCLCQSVRFNYFLIHFITHLISLERLWLW